MKDDAMKLALLGLLTGLTSEPLRGKGVNLSPEEQEQRRAAKAARELKDRGIREAQMRKSMFKSAAQRAAKENGMTWKAYRKRLKKERHGKQ